MEYTEQAIEKLRRELKDVKGQKELVMANSVEKILEEFCKQEEEFAQAVVQGKTFGACMNAVAKGVGNGISDPEAFERAVQFYFPGAKVKTYAELELCPGHNDRPSGGKSGMLLNLDDFL